MVLKVVFNGRDEVVNLPDYIHKEPICEYCYSKKDTFDRMLPLLYCRDTGIFWCDKKKCSIKASEEHNDNRASKCWTGNLWLHPRFSHVHITKRGEE